MTASASTLKSIMDFDDFKDVLETVDEEEYDLSKLSTCLNDVHEEEKRRKEKGVEELMKSVTEMAQTQQAKKNPMGALPVQVGYSLQFHHAVVDQYERRHGLKNCKDEFMRKKAKRRLDRQKKKTSDYLDRKTEQNKKSKAKKRSRR